MNKLVFKIKYKGTEYELKETLDVIFQWEEILNKPWLGVGGLGTTYQMFIYMYSMFIGNGNVIDFNEFKQYVDDNREFINEFFNGLVQPAPIKQDEVEEIEDKKKVSRKK